MFGRLDDFKQLDDVGVPDQLQDIDFSGHSQHVGLARDLALLQDFHCNLK